MVQKVDSYAQFKELIAADKLTVVDYYAVWCGPCKAISPYVEELAGQFPDVQFVKVDVDEQEQIAAEYGITAMPTFQFFKAGVKVHEFRGANKSALLDAVNKFK